ncbi:MAG: AI-2E family transporter [Gallionella sp.]|nr:AI-2E family transporter [Gallionella sp.]
MPHDQPSNLRNADLKAASETSAADAVAITIRTTRYLRMSVAVGTLTIIAIVAALYLARAFFVPLLIGILASYTLSPVVGWLKSCHVPRPVSAALVLAVLIGSLAWIAFSLSDDATAMIDKFPEAARELRHNLSDARTGPTALQNMQETAKQLEGAAADAGAKPGTHVVSVRPSESTTWLRDYALAQFALLATIVAQTPIILLLTYFLLASGAHFRLKLVQFVGPSLSRKKDVVRILDEIDVQIQRYLLSMLVSNALVGVGTWLAFEALGVEQAGVWGVAAGVLHFIPYLGPTSIALASGMADFLQSGSLLHALAIAGVSLLVAGAVGFVFATWLQSRFARVNAAVLFIALLFFGWLWGVWGLLLGAPLVAIAKVICDRVESLKPVGELLGR